MVGIPLPSFSQPSYDVGDTKFELISTLTRGVVCVFFFISFGLWVIGTIFV